ncbi:alkaline phosphatase PhoX [Aquabacterium sp. A08]|uniref:alkaline phosphatase PhoX n=1 Tax=Aquabacterium sp. A08 TaxID=2718532 RepID=UPI00141DC9B1|nr:alkaline phosphatase PhoX [Aquabacterium sp. A08]NIC42228.1 DUF839 domain-containing protein [Aquabacterium sp. A08]
MSNSRRDFVKLVGAGALMAPLAAFHARAATGGVPAFGPGFGPLKPMLPLNTQEVFSVRADGTVNFDLRGQALVSLPDGFSYRVVSCTGQKMSDGSLVPGDHDGMAAFRGPRGTTVLVRNHELSNRQAIYGDATGVAVSDDLKFDTYCNGGTTTLVLDESGQLLRDFASLGGTNNNCAGGPTPWGSWITCEENESLASGTYQRRHGYAFEVPALAEGPVKAEPLVAMGRFYREAIAVDPRTGIVYQTEDRGDGLIYRFVPRVPGQLAAGGKLEALKLKGDVATRLVTAKGVFQLNVPQAVEWVAIDTPDPLDNANSCRNQGKAKAAAQFARGEGIWYGNDKIYFTCTSGGEIGAGQVFAYDPRSNLLSVIVDSTDRAVLDAPDNITVGPDGRLYLNEDGGNRNFIVGVHANGELFQVAENLTPAGGEFCGSCFSHNGRFMFVNIQSPGLTLVIEGPWRKGQA